MSRYINADAVIAKLDEQIQMPTFMDCLSAINSAPSIDIVRCKECRWGKPYSDKQLECGALGLGGLKFPDDFCSFGERKESE